MPVSWVIFRCYLAFLPYFLYSKHIHLFFAPINFLLKPERKSIGEPSRLDFADEKIESYSVYPIWKISGGNSSWMPMPVLCVTAASRFARLITPARCLSPAALEINKRYFLNYFGAKIARGGVQPSKNGRIRNSGRCHLGLHSLWSMH